MPEEKVMFIDPDGTVTFIHDDQLMALVNPTDKVKTERASHIEPTADGRHWTADLSPILGFEFVLGPFPTRQAALDAEHSWLVNYLQNKEHYDRTNKPTSGSPSDQASLYRCS
jgi:hypothetical protein